MDTLVIYFLGTGDGISKKKQGFICNLFYTYTSTPAVRFGGPGSNQEARPDANFPLDSIKDVDLDFEVISRPVSTPWNLGILTEYPRSPVGE